MSETTTAATAAKVGAKAASKPVVEIVEVVATDHLNKVLPTVVETSETILELPSKVVVNQKLIFIVGIVGGAAVGAGIVFAVNKLRERKLKENVKKMADDTVEAIQNHNPNPKA